MASLSGGAIAGIVIACVVVAVLASLVGVYASKAHCSTSGTIIPPKSSGLRLAGQSLQQQGQQQQNQQGQQGQQQQGQQGQQQQGQQGQQQQGQQGQQQQGQQGQQQQGQQGQQGQQLVDAGMRAATNAVRQTWADAHAAAAILPPKLTPAAVATLASVADQTGRLPQVFASPDGDMMLHAMPGAARLNALDSAFRDDNDLAVYDPDAAAQFERAMASTGVPASWHLSEAEAAERKNKALVQAMLLEGNPSATAEEVLAAEPTMIATRAMVLRALAAQSQAAAEMQVALPQRFLYQGDLTRPAVPAPAMSPLVTDGTLTPGQENYLTSIMCGANLRVGAPEPY